MAEAGAIDLGRLYREHGHVVRRRAHRILGSEAEAAEVLQEVFLSLVDRPDQFRGDSSITTFLYAMTTNACLTRLRNSRRRAALVERELAPRGEPVSVGPDATVDAQRFLAALPERLARVAVYYYLDEMTHEEIAELLGVSRRQVGNLVNRITEEARKRDRAA
ncbi:MAG TPA: sigma-70 family RNA polymerase sigma factor [Kofleriaceae bacterium]|nr:sigma-70 family RNA polymerase sigma factor [Kofleriaceae bacterium]